MSFPGIAFPELIVRDIADTIVQSLLVPTSASVALARDLVASLPDADRASFLTALHNRPGKVRLGFARDVPEDWQVVVMQVGSRPLVRTVGDEHGEDEDVVFATELDAHDGITADGDLTIATTDDLPDDLPPRGVVSIDGGAELAIYVVASGNLTLAYRGVCGTRPAAHDDQVTLEFLRPYYLIGWDEVCTIRLDVLSSVPFFGAVLVPLLKAGIIAARDALDVRGLTLRSADESALAPRPIAWPAELQNRTVTCEFQRAFAVPETFPVLTGLEPVLTSVEGAQLAARTIF